MRLVLSALALLILAAPAWSQSQFADGEGTYITFDEFRLSSSGGVVDRFEVGGEVGRRLGNGVDVGVVGSYGTYDRRIGSPRSGWSLGATAGITRPAPLGAQARVRGLVAYTAHSFPNTATDGSTFGWTSATGDLTATLARTVPVVGSVKLQPTVGMYGRVDQMLSVNASDTFQRRDGPVFDVGVQFELPVRFRLFGTDVALSPAVRYSIVNGLFPGRQSMGSGLLRVNF